MLCFVPLLVGCLAVSLSFLQNCIFVLALSPPASSLSTPVDWSIIALLRLAPSTPLPPHSCSTHSNLSFVRNRNLIKLGWYYYGPRMGNSGLPKRATLKAFIRASTLSLGSIAFGSLIVTILEIIRLLLQAVQQYEAGQGDSESSAKSTTWKRKKAR